MKLFKKQTEASITNSTSAFMPGGRAFIAKGRDGSILRKFLQGVSKELFRIDEQIKPFMKLVAYSLKLIP